MNFTELNTKEFDSTFSLLEESKLDSSDLKQPNVRLFSLNDNDKLVGVGGLEIMGSVALLRSVAVKPDVRGKGIGKELVAQIEQVAKHSGIKALYLLTKTAANFFQTIGHQRIERNNFAESLKRTAQFTGLCPVSAVCMIKEI